MANNSQKIDGTVSGENDNTNTAIGNVVLAAEGARYSDPSDTRDCYQRGECGVCKKRPNSCKTAEQYLPAEPWYGCNY